MTKIQVTDSTDEKKPVVKPTKAVQKSPKKVVRKAVDARVAVPKPIKKITIGKEEKSEKVKKTTKQIKPVKKVKKIKPKQSEVKPEQTVVKPKQPKIAHYSAAASSATHNFLQKSTTLSRRYVKLPKITQVESPKIKSEKIKQAEAPNLTQPKEEPKLLSKKTLELETPKAEPVKLEAPKVEVVQLEAPKAEPVKLEAPKVEVVQLKTPKDEVPKLVKTETPKLASIPAEPAIESAKTTPVISAPKTIAKVTPAEASITPAQSKADIKAAKRAEKAKRLALKQAAKAAKIAESKRIAAAKRAESINKKDKAIKSAMHSVATMNETGEEMHNKFHKKRKGGRVLLAILCSAVTVAGLVAFVHFNMPDISVKVAAIQTGIDASYPSIIPRGYTLKNVSSDKDGEIAMTFENSEGYSFSLTEEKSTWDSNALLNNYVKKNFAKDYSTMREQGITIYSDNESAAWVNGGILYKVKSYIRNLSKEQIRNLATSIQ